MAGANFEHLTGEARGIPVAHGKQAAGFENPRQLGGDDFRPRSEHGAEHRDDSVEGSVGVWQMLGVAFVKGDREIRLSGALSGLFDKIHSDIDAGYDGSATCSRDRGVAGAACY